MNNPINVQQNNNNRRFNNPFNLDPDKEDICIEKQLDKDIFCPFFAFGTEFGEDSNYYGMRYVEPLKESFFHAIEALIFPNATLFQISVILCYIIIVAFIITLCFGLDETNLQIFLPVKLSTVDTLGSFYPKKIKENPLEYYRLLTCHFFHISFSHLIYSIIGLISFCSFFEILVKRKIFLLIFFLSGIITNISTIPLLKNDERFCGINTNVNGAFGAFIMLFIMNWDESEIIMQSTVRLVLYSLCTYIFFSYILFERLNYGNLFVNLASFVIGALIFAVIAKPIKIKFWKNIVRIFSGIVLLTMSSVSLIGFHMK